MVLKITRRQVLGWAAASGAAVAAMGLPVIARAQSLEKTDITIAVGGKPLVYYLALSIAELQGFFADEGLNVSIVDFAGGSKALQAVVGGSADVVSGAFEHTLSMHSKGMPFRAFVAQGRTPMIGLGVSTQTMANYQSPADLSGKRIGVTAPGASTNIMVNMFLTPHGVRPNDVSFVGVGTGVGAVNAMRSGQIDAIANTDPVISMLEQSGDIKVVADTRTVEGTVAVYGGSMPSSCLYAPESFITSNPNVAQALANAIVRADKWIQQAGPEGVAQVVPQSYLLGDPELYKASLGKNMDGLSPDGYFDPEGAQTAQRVLSAFMQGFDGSNIDLSQTWTNQFAQVANQKYA